MQALGTLKHLVNEVAELQSLKAYFNLCAASLIPHRKVDDIVTKGSEVSQLVVYRASTAVHTESGLLAVNSLYFVRIGEGTLVNYDASRLMLHNP